MLSRLSEQKDPSCDGPAICLECSRKVGEASSAGYIHKQTLQKCTRGQCRTITPLTWLCFGVEPKQISYISENCNMF